MEATFILAIQQIARPCELDPLLVASFDPGQLFEPLHDVMGMAQAHVRGLGDLLETPCVLRVHEKGPHDAGGPGSEE